MINLAVISLKDIIKFLKYIFLFFIIIIVISKVCVNIKNDKCNKIDDLKKSIFFDYSKIFNDTFTISNYFNNEKIVNTSGIKKILVSELSLLYTEEELMEIENQEELLEFDNTNLNVAVENFETIEKEVLEEESNKKEIENKVASDTENINNVENISINLPTKIIELNNKKDTYTDIYKSVKIKNESKYKLTEDILIPNFNMQNKKDIIIYHTHTCESYTPTEKDSYIASGNFRTTDLNYSVTRVGSELEKYLTNTFNVKHNTTYHDYPAYSGSYTRALSTIKSMVSENYSRFGYRLT